MVSSTMIDSTTVYPTDRQPAEGGRRAWVKPRVILRETLEAVAADCSIPGGKSDPTCTVGFS